MIDMLIQFPLKSVGIQYMMGDVLICRDHYLLLSDLSGHQFLGEKKRPSTAMDHCLMIIPRIMNIIPSVKTQLGKAAILAKPVRVKMITIIIDIIIPTINNN